MAPARKKAPRADPKLTAPDTSYVIIDGSATWTPAARGRSRLATTVAVGLTAATLSILADWAIVRAIYGDRFAGRAHLESNRRQTKPVAHVQSDTGLGVFLETRHFHSHGVLAGRNCARLSRVERFAAGDVGKRERIEIGDVG